MTDRLKQARERVSFVITVYNCDDLVSRCLLSLSSCFDGIMPETIVMDNAGLDSTKELMGQFGVRYEQMPKDGGSAGANNVGYKLCTKEFVCLVNSDTVFHENPFSELIDFMDAHPKAQIAQGTVILRNGIAGEDGKTDVGSFSDHHEAQINGRIHWDRDQTPQTQEIKRHSNPWFH